MVTDNEKQIESVDNIDIKDIIDTDSNDTLIDPIEMLENIKAVYNPIFKAVFDTYGLEAANLTLRYLLTTSILTSIIEKADYYYLDLDIVDISTLSTDILGARLYALMQYTEIDPDAIIYIVVNSTVENLAVLGLKLNMQEIEETTPGYVHIPQIILDVVCSLFLIEDDPLLIEDIYSVLSSTEMNQVEKIVEIIATMANINDHAMLYKIIDVNISKFFNILYKRYERLYEEIKDKLQE